MLESNIQALPLSVRRHTSSYDYHFSDAEGLKVIWRNLFTTWQFRNFVNKYRLFLPIQFTNLVLKIHSSNPYHSSHKQIERLQHSWLRKDGTRLGTNWKILVSFDWLKRVGIWGYCWVQFKRQKLLERQLIHSHRIENICAVVGKSYLTVSIVVLFFFYFADSQSNKSIKYAANTTLYRIDLINYDRALPWCIEVQLQLITGLIRQWLSHRLNTLSIRVRMQLTEWWCATTVSSSLVFS